MNTSTLAQPRAKKHRKRKMYVVTLDGVPCGRIRDKRFGWKLVPAGGTLVQMADAPELFPGEKSAYQAIRRAERLRNRLTNAVCEVGSEYALFTRPGDFKVAYHSMQ